MQSLARKQIVVWSIVLTVLLEVVTLILRFGFQLESTRDTASTIGVITLGIRVHHGYIGLLVVGVAFLQRRREHVVVQLLTIVGSALLFSDLVHHFLVLWPVFGSPQFHLVY